MNIENHMVLRDHDYYEQMSGQSWMEETEPCPMCNGDKYVGRICKCGVKPGIEDDECVYCGTPIHWEKCGCCMGKGEIPV